MKYHCPPYEINREINALIQNLEHNFNVITERKILDLLNRIDAYSDMSRYQLSLTKKALGDCYFDHGITGNAIDMYKWALADYSRLPIKRRLSSLQKEPSDSLIYSLDVHTVSKDGIPHHTRTAHEYDPEHEEKVETALNRLGRSYKEEFYRLRGVQEFYDSLSDDMPDPSEINCSPIRSHPEMAAEDLAALLEKCTKEIEHEFNDPHNQDTRLLKSMAKSKHYEDIHEEALAQIRNSVPLVDSSTALTKNMDELTDNELHFVKYLHHKPVSLPNVPGYFTHEYHLDYCHALQTAFHLGLIGYASASYALGKKTVAELKIIMQQNDCPASGKKSDLITAVLKTVGPGPYSRLIYELTEKGKELILGRFPETIFYD